MFSRFKNKVILNVKNLIGWKTKRRIIVFAVDDYGNVRVNSRKARENMDKAGLPIQSVFDYYDSLENEEDLLSLYEVLSSVKDVHGRHPMFTAFALPANIDFEKMRENNFRHYIYELLPDTFSKLAGYQNVYSLWREGISKKLIIPQFHGREHLNIKMLMFLLDNKDRDVLTCFLNRSYTSISSKPFSAISYTASFAFEEFSENNFLQTVIEDGILAFEKVFGAKPDHFTAPAMQEHFVLHSVLKNHGVHYIDTPLMKHEHQGGGRYKKYLNYTGKTNSIGQLLMVRNCVFEPIADKNVDWVRYTLRQIEAAFRWNKPAIISSHRVNFSGHIEPKNRHNGLTALKSLLQQICKKWPDVEFMTSSELGNLIENNSNR